MLYSFLGWLIEVTVILIKEKRFVNRGITNGPMCTLYGFIAVILNITLKDIENPFIVFGASLIYSTVIQYLTGKILVFLNKKAWWDYSNKKYNLEGYICLNYSLIWGFFGTIIVRIINPILFNLFSSFNIYVAGIVELTISGLLLVDLLSSFITLKKIKHHELTDDDKKALEAGQNVDIKISVTDASNEVSADAKIAIEAALKAAADKDASVNVGQYLDISIKKTVGEASSDVTETAKAISFNVDIPETMKNTDKNVSRTYYIIRMHDGKAEVIPSSVENDKITFATDKFSTYALAYADASVKSDDGTNTNPDDSKKDDGTNTNPDDSKKDDGTITTPDDSKKDDTTITTPDNGNNAAGGTSTGSTTDTTATTPKTGDTNASMWMLLAIMGMAGIAFVTAKKRGLVRK